MRQPRKLLVALCLLTGVAHAQSSPSGRPALELLQARASRQLPQAAGVQFVAQGTNRLPGGGVVSSFGVRYRGLPVLGARALVQLETNGKLRKLTVALPQWPASITPAVSRAEARAKLAARARFELPTERVQLGLYVGIGGARLAWFGYPVVPASIPSSPRLVLDAQDGSLIEAIDRAIAADARVYPANPVSTPDLQIFDLPLPEDAPSSLAHPLLVTKNCVDRGSVKPTQFGISVHLCDLEATAQVNAEGNYRPEPIDDGSAAAQEDAFSQLSMYYHSARATRFFQQLQGDDEASVASAPGTPLTAISNLRMPAGFDTFDVGKISDPNLPLEPFDNAFFSPGGQGDFIAQTLGVPGPGLYFGQGQQFDYAYDGDVVYHEFTHAVVGQTLELASYTLDEFGLSAAPGAANEALSDYFAAALSGDPLIGEHAGQNSGDGAIRDIASDETCLSSVAGQSHQDSVMFSSALWTARAQLDEPLRAQMDASLYKTMLGNRGLGTPTFEELAALFLEGLETDVPSAAPLLVASLTARGLWPRCTRIFDRALGERVNAPLGIGVFFAPAGASAGLRSAPGVLQAHYTFPEGTSELTVRVDGLQTYGGGLSFGGGGSFMPSLMVRFGAEPLQWSIARRPEAENDGEIELQADQSNEVTVAVPAGATEVYLQIVNYGDSEGLYTSLVASVPTPVEEGVTPEPAPPQTERPTTDATPADDDGGCGCRQAPSASGALSWLPAIGLLALLRRRRGQGRVRGQ